MTCRLCVIVKGTFIWSGESFFISDLFFNTVNKSDYICGVDVCANELWLGRSQCASGRPCDPPLRSRFSVIFLGTRANSKLVSRFHVSLLLSHSAVPVLLSKFLPRRSPSNLIKFSSKYGPPSTDSSPHSQVLSSAAYSNSPRTITLLLQLSSSCHLHFSTVWFVSGLP